MADRRSKYYEQQVLALREAQEEAIAEEPESGKAMVLNLSIQIDKAQTQEMIGAKRYFFFKFIEQEVAALRYQVAQEQNHGSENPKKTGGCERTFAQKKVFEREGATGKPSYGKEIQVGKPYNKNKKLPLPLKTLVM